MKRISAPLALVICCTFIMFCTGSARAQQLSQTDKDKALQLLESTRKDVLDATKGLSDAQWNFKIAPIAGRLRSVWSTLLRLRTTSGG